MTTKNNWLENNTNQIEYYLSSQDKILVERKRAISILVKLFSYQFGKKSGLRILDIGSGDGILTQIISDTFPGNTCTGIDGSQEMIKKAKKRLHKYSVNYLEKTFEQYIADPTKDNNYDFVFSSMAIHHLPFMQKKKLYEKIYHELRFNGLFINFDIVLPVSSKSEEWQFNLWRDWILENLELNSEKIDIETYKNLPNIYKNKSENKPSRLGDQLAILSEIGFQDVECYFKYGIFVLFGALKNNMLIL